MSPTRGGLVWLGLLVLGCGRIGFDALPQTAGGSDAGPGPDARPSADAGPTPDGGRALSRCALPAAFDEGATYARELHVATTGSASGDGSVEDPVDGIETALGLALPGDRILVHAGRYIGENDPIDTTGTAESPIEVRPAGDGDAIIDGGADIGLHMRGASFVVIDGRAPTGSGRLIFEGGSAPIRIDENDALLTGIVVRNTVLRRGATCLRVFRAEALRVEDNEISECNWGIQLFSIADSIIAGNTIGGLMGTNVGIEISGGSRDVLVHGNTVRDTSTAVRAGDTSVECYMRCESGTIDTEAKRLWVVANVLERSGTEHAGTVAVTSCEQCTVAHNTIVDPESVLWVRDRYEVDAEICPQPACSGWRFCLDCDPTFGTTSRVTFVNNVVALSVSLGSTALLGLDPRPEAEIDRGSIVLGGNVYWAEADAFAGFVLPNGLPPDSTSMLEDPGFVDRASSDYHLRPTTAVRGAGLPVDFGPFAGVGDKDDHCFGAFPSPGAYEPR